MSVLKNPSGSTIPREGNALGAAYAMPMGDLKMAVLRLEGIAADADYILIDLSDSSNFPHAKTGKIRLYMLAITAEKKTDGAFIANIGVVLEVDATDGSVDWIEEIDLETSANPTDSTDRYLFIKTYPGGIDLEVASDVLLNILTSAGITDDSEYQTDVALVSPAGAGNFPGAGDLVMRLDEIADGGTISITVQVMYTTEEASS